MADVKVAAPFAERFNRAFDLATITAVAAWQIAAAGVALLASLDRYSLPVVAVAVWVVQLAMIALGAVLLLRRIASVPAIWLLAALDLAAGVAMVVVCPGDQLLHINWTWTTVGLIGVLLLLHRPLPELVSFLMVNAAIILVALLVSGNLHRHNIAGFVTLLYASASIQLAMMAGARVFRFSGGMAAAAAAEQWEIATHEAIIAEVAQARQARYRAVRELTVPILRGLAERTLDPGDPVVQHRCAAAEAVLRQLLAERGDIPHPVLWALQPGIDAAVQRGTVIEVVPVGDLPPMTDEDGLALAEVPLAVLVTTREYARVTLVATGPGHLSVSVLADGTATAPGPLSAENFNVTTDHDGGMLWVEVQWQRPCQSP